MFLIDLVMDRHVALFQNKMDKDSGEVDIETYLQKIDKDIEVLYNLPYYKETDDKISLVSSIEADLRWQFSKKELLIARKNKKDDWKVFYLIGQKPW